MVTSRFFFPHSDFAMAGWKHIRLGIHTESGGCDCSLKELLVMGTMVPETC
jgi:hypothetical protein